MLDRHDRISPSHGTQDNHQMSVSGRSLDIGDMKTTVLVRSLERELIYMPLPECGIDNASNGRKAPVPSRI